MQARPFDRSEHVYHSEEFVELVKDAVRFFNGTPVHKISLTERFFGTGVYAFYYTGKNEIYAPYAQANRLEYKYPIYVGEAMRQIGNAVPVTLGRKISDQLSKILISK